MGLRNYVIIVLLVSAIVYIPSCIMFIESIRENAVIQTQQFEQYLQR